MGEALGKALAWVLLSLGRGGRAHTLALGSHTGLDLLIGLGEGKFAYWLPPLGSEKQIRRRPAPALPIDALQYPVPYDGCSPVSPGLYRTDTLDPAMERGAVHGPPGYSSCHGLLRLTP